MPLRALELDYRRSSRLPETVGIVLLLVGTAAVLQIGTYYYRLSQELALWDAKLAQVERLQRHAPGKRGRAGTEPEQVGREMKQARAALLKIGLPWDELFQSVEASRYDEVALLAIDPDPQKKRVTISGEARSVPYMLQYLRVLQEAPSLSEVYLHSHQVQQQDPEKPIHFTVEANWATRP